MHLGCCLSVLLVALVPLTAVGQIESDSLGREYRDSSPRQRSHEYGQVVAGYGYDQTHGPRLGVGVYEVPAAGHLTGFYGYGFTGTVDARFGEGRTVMQPSIGAQFWLLFLTFGAEVAAPTDFTSVWCVPRLHLGLGFFGTRLTFAIALAPELPEGMGRLGAQLEVPFAKLWESRW